MAWKDKTQIIISLLGICLCILILIVLGINIILILQEPNTKITECYDNHNNKIINSECLEERKIGGDVGLGVLFLAVLVIFIYGFIDDLKKYKKTRKEKIINAFSLKQKKESKEGA